MSRSKRSAPTIGITTAESEKDDKRAANRALRRVTRGKHRRYSNDKQSRNSAENRTP